MAIQHDSLLHFFYICSVNYFMVPLFMFFVVVIIVGVVVLHFCGFLHKIWLGTCLEKVPVKDLFLI